MATKHIVLHASGDEVLCHNGTPGAPYYWGSFADENRVHFTSHLDAEDAADEMVFGGDVEKVERFGE